MAGKRPLVTTKKTYFYNFFPSKDEEEDCKVNNTPWVVTRELIEVRDMYPAPKINLRNPWQIKKTITHDELLIRKLVIPFFETLQYVLRYWKLRDAKSLDNGIEWRVGLWDITVQNEPKIQSIGFRKLPNDNYCLSCRRLFSDHGLAVGDEIGLYWDPMSIRFMFKLLSQVRA